MRATENYLFYGDNLNVLCKHVPNLSVDLVYLDPPFKRNQDYNVLFEERSGTRSAAQIKAFEDTWTWDEAAAQSYRETVEGGGDVAKAMQAFRMALGETDMLAYLSMMAPRLVELERKLKPTGSLYLHCDPTASHYLKALLDAVFGADTFWNEIIWKRTSGHSDARRYGRVHDVLLYYSKADKPKWNKQYQAYDEAYVRQYYRYSDPDGRRFMSGDLGAAGLRGGGYEYSWKGVNRTWRVPKDTMKRLDDEGRIFYTRNGIPRIKRYLDEAKGLPVQDVWTDIEALRSWHAEKLGYPTQKPEALLERIIRASTDEGDTVLDPFCGCGTASAVAHRLKRRWIGIDITHLAVAVIRYRLRRDFTGVKYNVVGEPESLPDAEALAADDPYQFQWWALGLLGINPMQKKKGADKGIDGRLYFHERGDSTSKQVVISVKAGHTTVSHVRDLLGVLQREKADIGVLVSLKEPTQPMRIEAVGAGHYTSSSGTHHARLQLLTVEQLLAGRGIDLPASRVAPAAEAPAAPTLEPAPAEQLVLPEPPEDPAEPELEIPAEPEVEQPPPAAPKRANRNVTKVVDELLEAVGIQHPPVRLEPILESLNIELSARAGMAEDALAVPMTNPELGPPAAWMVYYNPEKPEVRRRYTIAHEIGHIALESEDWALGAAARSGRSRFRERERQMEKFAAELLMPARFVREAVRLYGPDADRLREVFRVSRQAMEIRLRELRLI